MSFSSFKLYTFRSGLFYMVWTRQALKRKIPSGSITTGALSFFSSFLVNREKDFQIIWNDMDRGESSIQDLNKKTVRFWGP